MDENNIQTSEYIGEMFVIKSPNGNIYKQVGFSGSGSFGKVFQVITQNNQVFAMKMIDMKKIQQTKEIEYVITEQEIMGCVNSPHILKIHDQFLYKEDYILITDFCEGGDLHKIIREQYKDGVSEEKALDFLKQILEGFAELHKLKIIHRDLKLSNLLMNKGCIVIGDFGLAKIGVNSTNSIVGSLLYMAPEILVLPQLSSSSAIPYTSQVDVWSIGVCFYIILTGKLPFPGPNKTNLQENIKNFSGNNLVIHRQDISETTVSLLKLMLQMHPEERINFPTLFELFEIEYEKPLEITEAVMMEIERSVFVCSQPPIEMTLTDDAETTSNSKSNAEMKINLENEAKTKSHEQSYVYLDIFIGMREENQKLVCDITFTVNMIIFYMSVSKEISRIKEEIEAGDSVLKSEIEVLDFILFRKSYLFLCEIKNLLEDKPSIFNLKFPHYLFSMEDLQRYDMLLFSIMNKLNLFFSQKKYMKNGKIELMAEFIPFYKMNLLQIDEFIKQKIKNCWFWYMQTEGKHNIEERKVILKVIYLAMHSVNFNEFFGVAYKKKPSMFVNFHRDIKSKSFMALKNWIQLAFVIHKKSFDFFK